LKFLDKAKDDIKETLIASCEIHFNKLITDNYGFLIIKKIIENESNQLSYKLCLAILNEESVYHNIISSTQVSLI